MNINYFEYLQTPQWQEKRRQALARADYHCPICGIDRGLGVTFHTHHIDYDNLGDEPDNEITAVCSLCHKEILHGAGRYLFLHCKTCGRLGVFVTQPDPGWIRFKCDDGHIVEKRL